MTEHILNSSQAAALACKTIVKNTQDEIADFGVIKVNRFGHHSIRTKRGLKYYSLYKREVFKTFGHQFEDSDLSGVGESINLEFLQKAKELECVAILFVSPTGKVYCTYIAEFETYMKTFGTVRETRETHETTVSIPIKLLRAWST